MQTKICVTDTSHVGHSSAICQLIEESAKQRGTGIAKRDIAYIQEKINTGNAVIAISKGVAVGFCYIESWENKQYVVNSGLVVHPDFRKTGLAKKIKLQIFKLSREKYPNAKLFGITTSLAVMKINSDLGYKPVTFSELTTDDAFWKGCLGCKNQDILQRTNRTMCLCTGMISDLKKKTPLEKIRNWSAFKKLTKQPGIIKKQLKKS